jgi:hypothetical protein
MEPRLYHPVRITRADPAQGISAGDEGALLDWLDAPAGGEKGAVVELYDRKDDPVVTIPASWIEAVAEGKAGRRIRACGDGGLGEATLGWGVAVVAISRNVPLLRSDTADPPVHTESIKQNDRCSVKQNAIKRM